MYQTVREKNLMLLECPNCGTNFKVPAQALGEVGRTVRCSQCAFEWFAEPRDLKDVTPQISQVHETADTTPPTEEESHIQEFGEDILSALDSMDSPAEEALARRAERRKSGEITALPRASTIMPAIAALAASFLLFVFAALLYFQQTFESLGLAGLYDTLGLSQPQEVKFASITAGKLIAKRTAYVIQGNVVNTGKKDTPIPTLQVRLVDKAGSELRAWSFDQDGIMKAGQALPFDTGKLDASFLDKAHSFILDIGGGYNLMLRD